MSSHLSCPSQLRQRGFLAQLSTEQTVAFSLPLPLPRCFGLTSSVLSSSESPRTITSGGGVRSDGAGWSSSHLGAQRRSGSASSSSSSGPSSPYALKRCAVVSSDGSSCWASWGGRELSRSGPRRAFFLGGIATQARRVLSRGEWREVNLTARSTRQRPGASVQLHPTVNGVQRTLMNLLLTYRQ